MKLKEILVIIVASLIIAVIVIVAIEPPIEYHSMGYMKKEKAIEIVRAARKMHIIAGWGIPEDDYLRENDFVFVLMDKSKTQEFWNSYW